MLASSLKAGNTTERACTLQRLDLPFEGPSGPSRLSPQADCTSSIARSLRDQILSVEEGEDRAGDHSVAVRGVVAVVVVQPLLFISPVGAQGGQDVQVGDTAARAELAAAVLRIGVLICAQHLYMHGEESNRERNALLASLLFEGRHNAVQDLPGPRIPGQAEILGGVVDLEVEAVLRIEHLSGTEFAARAETLSPFRIDLGSSLAEEGLAHDLDSVRRPGEEAAPREGKRNRPDVELAGRLRVVQIHLDEHEVGLDPVSHL